MRKFNVIIDGVSYGVEVEETVETISKQNTLSAVAEQQIKAEEPVAKPAAEKVSNENQPQPQPQPQGNAVPSGEGHALKSPLPGMIINFKTTSGAAVKKGQIVLILEAMKMENEIAANEDGIITFNVAKGTNVATGDILAYIK